MFILHVFSSANEQAAKETMAQERRARQQHWGHCWNQSLLPRVPEHTTNKFHFLNTFGNTETTVQGPRTIECCSITPLPYNCLDTLMAHSHAFPQKIIPGVVRAPSLCWAPASLLLTRANHTPLRLTSLVMNLDTPYTGDSNRNIQPCSFAFLGLFLGIVISEGITIECNLHTKERCDQFCVITHEANADSDTVLDFLKLCLCP